MACSACKQKGKFKQILDGWGNWIFKDKEVESLAKSRALICATCDKNKMNICADCGCLIPAKTRSIDSHCHKWRK